MKQSSWILVILLLISHRIDAQDLNFVPPASPPKVLAKEIAEPIVLDGKLTEKAWSIADPIADFFRMEPRQGGEYLYPTTVKILFDRKNIYFGVFCKDSLGKKGMRVQDLRRDFIYGENDIFYIQLDPQNLKRYCVSFQTTPYGNQRDLQVFDDSFRDNNWDALWKVRTHITDSGYYAEFAIPFAALRYDSKSDSASWGLTLARLARRDYEVTVFPAIPQTFSPYRMTYAAQLKGLKLPPTGINLRFQPYTLYQYNSNTNALGDKVRQSSVKPGGEIKWAINPESVMDVTFNTDFAQADVDMAVNNLTRFNVLFPERRQFFLENSGIYAGADVRGLKPFFSRTIGLSNTQFNADPVAIDAGVRYTSRNQSRTLAGLYVHQQGTATQGASNFGVMRYLKNYGTQSNIGVMLTHRLDEADRSKGFSERNNTTLTIDGFVRPKDDFNIQYLLTASRNNTNDSLGFAGNFWVEYTPNNYYLKWKTTYIDEKYLPGMGFTFATNVMYHNGGGYYIWRPQKGLAAKLIRRWDPGVLVETYQDGRTMNFQNGNLYLFPVYIIFRDNSQFEYAVIPTWEQFFFSPLGFQVKPGKYTFTRQKLRYNSDASKKISFNVNYFWGNYYDGRLNELNLGMRVAPHPKITFTGDYQLNQVRKLGINRVNEDVSLWSVGCRLAANPRMQLNGFYQYNSFDQRGRWNVRGSWEFAPLSFLYLVFNDNSFRGTPINSQSLITKLTYLKQF